MAEHASVATPSYGFQFLREGVQVKSVTQMPLPDIDNEEKKVTHLSSPNRKHEFRAVFSEDAPVDLMIDFNPDESSHVALFNDANDPYTLRTYGYIFPDGVTSISGTGYIRNWKWRTNEAGEMMGATFTLRESPAWDWDGLFD